MTLFGSHEEKSTEFLKNWIEENPNAVESIFGVSDLIFTDSGCLLTTWSDDFLVFVFKAQKLHATIKALVEKRYAKGDAEEALGIQIDDEKGSWSLVSVPEEMVKLNHSFTTNGNTKYHQWTVPSESDDVPKAKKATKKTKTTSHPA